MPACTIHVEQLKNLLLHFIAYTWLRINYEKSAMVPINSTPAKMEIPANSLGCNIGSFPFTYLGLPLSLTKPKLEDFVPVIKRIDKRLAGCSTFLSYGDKLTLMKSVFTSLPTFFMCTLMSPANIVEQINKYPRHCFWRKYGMEDKGMALISWDKVCLPKDQGGLGVLQIAAHNKCLLMKHLHKFLNHFDLPWVHLIWESYHPQGVISARPVGSFWWKSILKLLPQFNCFTKGIIGQGNTISLWEDNWGVGPLMQKYLELLSFSSKTNLTLSAK